jgi:hypothetical protein
LRRGQVVEVFRKLPPCLIGIEACATALRAHLVEIGLVGTRSADHIRAGQWYRANRPLAEPAEDRERRQLRLDGKSALDSGNMRIEFREARRPQATTPSREIS